MQIPPITKKSQVRAIFLTLRAFRHPKKKWGITPAGWEAYSRHWSPLIRAAVRAHPDCPMHIRLRRLDAVHDPEPAD